jgi:hypothetical protein
MGFGDWIKGLFGKKDEAASDAPTSATSSDAAATADTAATGGGEAADAGQPSDSSTS